MRVSCGSNSKLIGWFALILVAVGCGGSNRHPAEVVVAGYYGGLSRQDTNAVMDAVEPADRVAAAAAGTCRSGGAAAGLAQLASPRTGHGAARADGAVTRRSSKR